jgi:hypothetical protein
MDNSRVAQRARRDALFLRGPIKFGWIRQNVPDPTSRLILVVRGFMNMADPIKTEYELSLKVWDCAGIYSPDQRTRVLKKIDQHCEGYWIEQRKGRTSVLHEGCKPK